MKILKFYSDHCGPCKQQSKILDKVNVEVESIDVENANNILLVEHYNILNLPTLVVLDDEDNVIHRFNGLTTQDKLESFIAEYEETDDSCIN